MIVEAANDGSISGLLQSVMAATVPIPIWVVVLLVLLAVWAVKS